MVITVSMAVNSRALLFAGAISMVLIIAGASVTSGSGWNTSMSLVLIAAFIILSLITLASFLDTSSEKNGSTPTKVESKIVSNSNELSSVENLPDPENEGINLPIL